MYKISIIIPVYNAEFTLERSINSILNQKWDGDFYKDIEVIFIDDCSTDNSVNIIKKYLEVYPNFSMFSTNKNSGFPSEPRNIGINQSNGKYLMFMDNDDKYCVDMCKTLYNTITDENADIVSCNHYKSDSISIFKGHVDYAGENIIDYQDKVIFENRDAIFFTDIFIWTKIFKKTLITDNNIYFPSKHLEDEFFSINTYLNCDKLIYLKNYCGIIKYVYDDSLGNVVDMKFVMDYINGFEELYNLIDSNIDFKNYLYKFNHVKKYVRVSIAKISCLEDNNDILVSLRKLNAFEKHASFDNSLNEISFKFINFFILKNNLLIAMILIKLMNNLKKSNFIRHLYRLLAY